MAAIWQVHMVAVPHGWPTSGLVPYGEKALVFSVIQSMQTYEGKSPVIHRLKRIQNVANILFIFAGISMVDTVYTFTEKWLGNPQLFYSIFYGKWIVVMLVASILELYTTFRISHEMKGGECK